MVLAGRCYQRESVPFKTLDAMVDALTGYLLALPPEEVARLLPPDVVALARLFPVLRRVPQIAEPEVRRFHLVDAPELRRRGFSALRELLATIAVDRPVILCVDDLQWGDPDSAVFLADLVARADRPKVLVVLAYRTEDEGSTVIAAIHRRTSAGSFVPDVRYLDVEPLTTDEARELVRTLAPVGGRSEDQAEALLREAGGNTMFLAELARVRSSGASSLDQLIRQRIAALPDDARALLRACAVAARPTDVAVVAQAAGVADPTGALARLRVERLLRPSPADGALIETYHDRIRSGAPRRAGHRRAARGSQRPGPGLRRRRWRSLGRRAGRSPDRRRRHRARGGRGRARGRARDPGAGVLARGRAVRHRAAVRRGHRP